MNYNDLKTKVSIKLKDVPNLEHCLGEKRSDMPQISNFDGFMDDMKRSNIVVTDAHSRAPESLKPTQKHFNNDKIKHLMLKSDSKPILVSSDGYILDGHHRWLSQYNRGEPVSARTIGLGIDDLMAHVHGKDYVEYKKLSEDTAPVVSVGNGAISQEPVVRRKKRTIMFKRKEMENVPSVTQG